MNDEQQKNPPDVMVICDAYESGYGHGLKDDGMCLSHTHFASPEEAEAYGLGYDKGKADREKPVTYPQGWRLVNEDYQRIFNAISAGTNLTRGDVIQISVRSFWEYLDKNQPIPPQGN